jgi:N-sulfoglucosamine sulfohydrolase
LSRKCLLVLITALFLSTGIFAQSVRYPSDYSPNVDHHVDNKPNVIIFIMDDVGQGDVGVFGNAVVETPNIDKLAAEGMRFDNAFLTTSSCSPSRASFLTGLYPTATGARDLHDPLPAEKTSLPQLLHNAGYYTASIGKWHLGEPFKSHFDRVVEPRDESGALDWLPELARRPEGKPFFFWLASKDAHDPFNWHTPLRHQDPSRLVLPPRAVDNAFTRQVMAQYYDEIARVDYNIGLVVNSLRKQKILDNTVIIVLSDNGSIIGNAKTTLYDPGLKTPLVIRFPSLVKQGIANQQLVSAVDIMPTVLAMAGLPAVSGNPGVSILPTLLNPEQPVRNYIHAERNKHGAKAFERSIRTNRYLYKRNYFERHLCDTSWDAVFDPDIPRDSVYEEFYDLQHDPDASHNIVHGLEYRDDLNAARQTLDQIMLAPDQHPPPLILEQCHVRQWHERIRWPLHAQ